MLAAAYYCLQPQMDIKELTHAIASNAQLFRPLLHLPLHVSPVPFVLLASSGTGRGSTSCRPPHLLFRAILLDHTFRRGAVGSTDQEIQIGGSNMLCTREPLNVGDRRPRRYQSFGVEELVVAMRKWLSSAKDADERQLRGSGETHDVTCGCDDCFAEAADVENIARSHCGDLLECW